jgi:superfamily I DNA and/or RNA helicase
LVDDARKAAVEEGLERFTCLLKVKAESEDVLPEWLAETTDNDAAREAVGSYSVIAGTGWLWAREQFAGSIDVLFVDEAGQMSLANALAVAQAAKNLVLLGDPQQLDQPLKGSHPDGADVSALEHLLDGTRTIGADRGLFLDQTWRLHPEICRFTSEAFYENRLRSRPGLENQRVEGQPHLRFVAVNHEGNQNCSHEEVDRIAELVGELTASYWVNEKLQRARLTEKDVLIVAPYNAQVVALKARLPDLQVGTVDKFQGQEAAVVIYSLATSSPEDAPRGMEFLYSLNRLNVATSRARALAILVASPKLLEPDCATPRQMRLANALCRFVELAGGQQQVEAAT